MNYRGVFDISQNGSQLAIWFLPPILTMLFLLIGWALKETEDPQMSSKGKLFMIFSGCGFSLSLLLLVGNFSEYYRAKSALDTGRCQVVEGTVQSFVPMPAGGHSTESFSVGKVSFAYGSGWGATIFNSEWNHGFIHDGARVRITSMNGDILRVETK
jgi:hypothetical protein